MTSYTKSVFTENTEALIKKQAVIETRNYFPEKVKGHLTLTLHSGWGMDKDVLHVRLTKAQESSAHKMVELYLSGKCPDNIDCENAYKSFIYKSAKSFGLVA